MSKPILCLDFDGVLHSYTSGWKGPAVIPDPPVPYMAAFLVAAAQHFQLHIFSSRSNQEGGVEAMAEYIRKHLCAAWLRPEDEVGHWMSEHIWWPTEKPPAMVTLDDRALTFDGTWPDIETLRNFKPWNK